MQRSLARLALLVFAILAGTSLLAQGQPDFPPLTGRVVDQAGLLDDATRGRLDARLAAHEAETTNQVVVATIASLDGYDIADYSNRLARAWEIGTADNDNGVVLVVAPQDREVRIEVGYGLEGALTDATSRIIIEREILPAFRDDDYPGGIDAGVSAILQAIDGEYTAPVDEPRQQSRGGIPEIAVPLIFLAIVGIMETLKRTGHRRVATGAFPAGVAGLIGTLATNSVLIGVGIGAALFALIWFNSRGGGSPGSGATSRRRRHRGAVVGGFGGGLGGGGLGGGGFGGGGGFSGGGGGFGGGGASGGW